MTIRQARRLPPVISVEQAGALIGLKRAAAYDAAHRGDIPVLRYGRRLLVPTARLLEQLGIRLDPGGDAA